MNIEEFEKIMQRDDKEEKEVRKNISGQGLPEELGKYMWLTKAHTSQEAPTSISGSGSRII